QYSELDEFDGNTVGRDRVPIRVNGETLLFSTTPKIIYHTLTLNVTYGITDDLDVNVAVPLHAIDFDANANLQRPGGQYLPYEGISVDRKDYFDAVVAARVRIWETIAFTGGVMKSLNDEG